MSMDRDSQNFRANYYQKLGSTSATEEKRNLTRLLGSEPVDLRKLEQFCQHLNVAGDMRCEVWKILLKISPPYRSTQDYVSQQRREHFEELSRYVDTMRCTDSEGLDDTVSKYNFMYLIECRDYAITKSENASIFSLIAQAVERMDFLPCDSYWISKSFTDYVKEKIHPHIPQLVGKARFHLQKEDIGGQLCDRLHATGAFDTLPFESWFSTCFADVLPETTFDRVWDKAIAGSSLVLVFVAVALILVYRRPILVMRTAPEIIALFSQVQPDAADEIVRRAVDNWLRNGGKLTPSSTKASPALGNLERSPVLD